MVLLQDTFIQFIPFNDISNAHRIDNSSLLLRILNKMYLKLNIQEMYSNIFINRIFGSDYKPISQVCATPAKFTRLLAEPVLYLR